MPAHTYGQILIEVTMDITQLRSDINQIDQELCQLFVRRMAIAAEIAQYKKTHGLPVLDSNREREVLQKVSGFAGEKFAPYACSLYQTLMDLSKAYQNEVLEQSSQSN